MGSRRSNWSLVNVSQGDIEFIKSETESRQQTKKKMQKC